MNVYRGMKAQSIATDTHHVLGNPWFSESTQRIVAGRALCGVLSLQWFAVVENTRGQPCRTCQRIAPKKNLA